MLENNITFGDLSAYYTLFALILTVVIPLVLTLNKNLIVATFKGIDDKLKTTINKKNENKIEGYVLYTDQFMYPMANFILFSLIVPVIFFFCSEEHLKRVLIKLAWEFNFGFLLCISYFSWNVKERRKFLGVRLAIILQVIGSFILTYLLVCPLAVTRCIDNSYLSWHILVTSIFVILYFMGWYFGGMIYVPIYSLLNFLRNQTTPTINGDSSPPQK